MTTPSASHSLQSEDLESFSHIPGSGREPKLLALMAQSEALVTLMHGFFKREDKGRSEDFRLAAEKITKAMDEIRELHPKDISQNRIPSAGAELDAITRDTEGATNAIMTAAETIMDFKASEAGLKDLVDDQVMKIFEACSFQDITGQRVSKIVKVLTQVEQLITRLAQSVGVDDDAAEVLSDEEKRRRDLLLNGPAIGGPETQQADIDDLFEAAHGETSDVPTALRIAAGLNGGHDAPPKSTDGPTPVETPNSQDDIDSLFA